MELFDEGCAKAMSEVYFVMEMSMGYVVLIQATRSALEQGTSCDEEESIFL